MNQFIDPVENKCAEHVAQVINSEMRHYRRSTTKLDKKKNGIQNSD